MPAKRTSSAHPGPPGAGCVPRSRPGAKQAAPRSRRAFTLLEAVLALGILAMVAAAVLQLRGQSLATAANLAERRSLARETDALVDMLHAGALGQPEPAPALGPAGAVWRGQHHGKPFEIRRVVVETPNPAFPGYATNDAATTPNDANRSDTSAERRGGVDAVGYDAVSHDAIGAVIGRGGVDLSPWLTALQYTIEYDGRTQRLLEFR